MKHLGNPLLGGVPTVFAGAFGEGWKAGRVLPDIGTEQEPILSAKKPPSGGSERFRPLK